MKIRRKQGSRPWIQLNARTVVLGICALAVAVYVVSFAYMVEFSNQAIADIKPDNVHNDKRLDIPADHGDQDERPWNE